MTEQCKQPRNLRPWVRSPQGRPPQMRMTSEASGVTSARSASRRAHTYQAIWMVSKLPIALSVFGRLQRSSRQTSGQPPDPCPGDHGGSSKLWSLDCGGSTKLSVAALCSLSKLKVVSKT